MNILHVVALCNRKIGFDFDDVLYYDGWHGCHATVSQLAGPTNWTNEWPHVRLDRMWERAHFINVIRVNDW